MTKKIIYKCNSEGFRDNRQCENFEYGKRCGTHGNTKCPHKIREEVK